MREPLLSLEQVIRVRLFKVADYQRPYSWQAKQLEDLWGDLDLLGSADHYTGTLVLRDSAEPPVYTSTGEELVVSEVVDGQQRLTTLIILLERLRRALAGLGSDEAIKAAGKLDELLRVDVDGAPRNRIVLAGDLNEFFDRQILGDLPATDAFLLQGQRLLKTSAAFFDDRLAELTGGADSGSAFERLMRVRVRAAHRLKFLVYEVENAAEVGVLFETLNGRGRDLSELERVKNYLLYLARQLPPGQQEYLLTRINSAWADVFKNLARVGRDDDTLLRAHWLVTQNSNERTWRGALSVKEKFPRSAYVHTSERLQGKDPMTETAAHSTDTGLSGAINDYVESLRMTSVYLRDVYDPTAEFSDLNPALVPDIRAKTAALRRSGKPGHFLPILIAVRLKYSHDGTKYLEALDLAERFSGRVFAVAGLRSNAGRTTITSAANNLYTGRWTFEKSLDALRAKALQLTPDSEVRRRFGEDQRWYPRSGLKFVLYEYELSGVRTEEDVVAGSE